MNNIDIMEYTPLLHKVAGKFPKKYREDLVQEGYLVLHRLSERFDPSKGTFESFVYLDLYHTFRRFVAGENTTVSLDEVINDEDGYETTYAEQIIDDSVDVEETLINQDYYTKNLENSTTIERFIKQRHYEEGMTPEEIVELYSELTQIKSVKTIKKILKK